MENLDIYKEHLDSINKCFTDGDGHTKRLLSATDVGKYLGIHRTRASKLYGIAKTGITSIELARKLASQSAS